MDLPGDTQVSQADPESRYFVVTEQPPLPPFLIPILWKVLIVSCLLRVILICPCAEYFVIIWVILSLFNLSVKYISFTYATLKDAQQKLLINDSLTPSMQSVMLRSYKVGIITPSEVTRVAAERSYSFL
jgi:hypothetical protein